MSEEIEVDPMIEQDQNAVPSRPGQGSATRVDDCHLERERSPKGAEVEPPLGIDERECRKSSTVSHQGNRRRRLIVCSDDESDDDDKAAVKVSDNVRFCTLQFLRMPNDLRTLQLTSNPMFYH